MNKLYFSFIIPVYNRPEEIVRLLNSINELDFTTQFEVVVIEDGSSISCKEICMSFGKSLNISYYYKSNSGPGDSRNYGMIKAKGNYFIILDSDCILPSSYLSIVEQELHDNFTHCYGGPDAAMDEFTPLQKAINYTMTSVFTTGGIRGGKWRLDKFQPRSFNMGISKEAFENSGGFGKIHPGEDPDLTIRLWRLGYKTQLINKAFVYHERRISWTLFFKQVNKFGIARVILNKWHPQTAKWLYWLPFLFCCFILVSVISLFLGWVVPMLFLLTYLLVVFLHSSWLNNPYVGILTVRAVLTQFMGYGLGYSKAWWRIVWRRRDAVEAFPKMFFK